MMWGPLFLSLQSAHIKFSVHRYIRSHWDKQQFCGFCIIIHIAYSWHTPSADSSAAEDATLETVSTSMFDYVSLPWHMIYNDSDEEEERRRCKSSPNRKDDHALCSVGQKSIYHTGRYFSVHFMVHQYSKIHCLHL